MAFLQNLIVTGSSKFLNKIYATDIEVDGTFETSGNLSVGGTLNVAGSTTLKAVTTTSISNTGTLSNGGGIELNHATPFIDFHFGKSTADYTSRIIEEASGTITIKPNLKVGTSATIPTATITTANITTGNLDSGTADNFNVTNKLHATHFDLQSVAQLGGAFYVSPTIKLPTDSNTTFTITKSGATANIIISDSAITSTTLAGVVWGTNAKVKASGKIGTVTTGTMDGTVTGINTSNHTLTISVSGENSSSIAAGTYTSANIDNFCVMMYNTGTYPVGIMMNSYGTDGRTYIDIHGGTSSATKPNVRIGNLGGLSFNGTTLSNQWGIYTNNGYYTGSIVANGGKIGGFTIGETAIYTGTITANSTNNIGLSSADFTRTIGGTSRTGLRFAIGDKVGITGNGTFYGSNIQVSGGKIGGWNIGTDYLYNQTPITTGTATTQYGVRLVTGTAQTTQVIKAGSRSYDGTSYGSWSDNFYVRNDGYIFAKSGNIGGWGINSDNGLIHGTIGNADSVFLIPKGSTGAKAIGGSASTVTGWTITSGTNFGVTKTGTLYCSDIHATGEITATSGHIGNSTNGFTIDSSGFYSGTKTANNSGYIAMSNTVFSRTINSTALNNLNLAIGSKFGVTSDGTLYANGLNIKNIDADNISIGTLSIERLTSLQIGGRNLLRDSALGIKHWVSNPVSGAVINNGKLTMAVAGEYYQSVSGTSARPDSDYTVIPAGTTLTLSCYFYENTVTTGNHRIYYMSKPSWKSFTIPVGFTGLWTQTFTTTEDITRTTIDYDLRNMSAGEKWVCGPCKLEIGNKATDWSPAPEDVDSSINQAQTTADTATTKIDNLKKPQLGWKVNYSAYTQVNNGECYFHGYDSNNAIADVDGKVDWNGEELTITKGMWINPNQSAPYNTPILHVYRTSTAPYHADVWWDNDLGKWRGYMYKTDKTPDVRGDWTWNEATDCILATYIEPSADGEIQSAQLFNPPKKYSELPDPSVSYNLDNLKIGGRNLFRDSALDSSYWTTGTGCEVSIDNNILTTITAGEYYQSVSSSSARPDSDFTTIPAGTTLTLSCYFYENTITTGNHRIFYASKPSWLSQIVPLGFTGLWSKTFTTTTDITRLSIDYDTRGMLEGEKWVCGPCKIEIGNKATDWSPAPEDVDSAISNTRDIANTALSQGVEYIVGTQTATTASWTGVTTDSALVAGKTIAYKLPQTSAANATLNLTLSTGGTTGAKAVYYNTTRVSTQYPANSIIHMTYDGSYWRITNYNSDTVNRIRLQNIITAAEAITAGNIICGTSSGYRDIGANISFDLTYPLLYAATAKAKGGTSDNNYLSINAINASSNGTITSGATKKTLYLKGTVNNNTFTISASPFMTTVVPTTEDGFIYIPLGIMYSASNIYFISSDKLYAYKDGGFKELSRGEASLAAKTATNYLYYDTTNGLVISSSASSQTYSGASTGYNTRLTNSALQIRNGTNVLASYGDTIVIGENGGSQQVIDNNSLNFNTPSGETKFTIKNEVIGHGFSQQKYIDLFDEDDYDNPPAYSNTDWTLNNTKLANIIGNLVNRYQMTSSPLDYAIGATTSNCTMVMEVFGYALDSASNNTPQYSLSENITFSIISLTNGQLTVKASESTSSDWTDFVTEFASLFPSGSNHHKLWVNFTLNYPIADVQMTLGSRNPESTIGTRSVSIGSNNIASGTGSIAIGKDLVVTDDYSVAIGQLNLPLESANTGEHLPTAFAIGANGTTPFAVLKNGLIIMSQVNSGASPHLSYGKGSKTNVRIDFDVEYPNTPFIFLTLREDDIPTSAISDYAKVQVFLQQVDTTGFTATVINGGDHTHSFSFNWFAICLN